MPFKQNPFTNLPDFYQAGGGGSGDVTGPASSTADNLASFADTTGKVIQDSGISSSDVPTRNNIIIQDPFVGNPSNLWSSGGGGGASTDVSLGVLPDHPGTFDLVLGSSGFANAWLDTIRDGTKVPIRFGSIAFEMEWIALTTPLSSNASNGYNFYIGFVDKEYDPPDNGLYFQYNDLLNGGKYVCTSASGGTRTTADSGVLADTDFHKFRIMVNAAATSASYYIDDALVATITTNIPTSNNTGPGMYIVNNGNASASATARADNFYLKFSIP